MKVPKTSKLDYFEFVSFDDLVDDISSGGGPDSVDPRPPVHISKALSNNMPAETFTMFLTLNHPRTKVFLNSDSDNQKKIYLKIWNKLILYRPNINTHVHSRYVFEYCKSGETHLHGVITYTLDPTAKTFFVAGIVRDTVKRYKACLKQNMLSLDKCWFEDWQRWREASICIQIPQTLKAIPEWETYMNKSQIFY